MSGQRVSGQRVFARMKLDTTFLLHSEEGFNYMREGKVSWFDTRTSFARLTHSALLLQVHAEKLVYTIA